MRDILHDLSDWLVGFADSDWAIGILGLASFFESIFFPVPPDPLLIAIAVVRQNIAILLGVWVTVTSVAGAFVGHWLGKRLGRPILTRMFSDSKILKVENLFARYGMWATMLAAFTPIPYKVFAITAGVLELDRKTFIIASLIGRGARFITIGLLIFLFGEEITAFMSDNFEIVTLGVSALAILAIVGWALYHRHRGRQSRRNTELQNGSGGTE